METGLIYTPWDYEAKLKCASLMVLAVTFDDVIRQSIVISPIHVFADMTVAFQLKVK